MFQRTGRWWKPTPPKQVTWVHSYVTPDRRKTFCVYNGPDEAAISRTAEKNGLPVDAITEVRVLDPYFYR
jgi:hypothetical protein